MKVLTVYAHPNPESFCHAVLEERRARQLGRELAVPFGRDQPEVARRVEVAPAGVRLPAGKLTAPRPREAVRDATNLKAGAEQIAAAFAAAGGPSAAADALEALARTPQPAQV